MAAQVIDFGKSAIAILRPSSARAAITKTASIALWGGLTYAAYHIHPNLGHITASGLVTTSGVALATKLSAMKTNFIGVAGAVSAFIILGYIKILHSPFETPRPSREISLSIKPLKLVL